MATLIDKGWFYLTNGTDDIKIGVEGYDYDLVMAPEISHYPGGFHMGYDLEELYLVLKVKNIILESVADKDTFISNVKSWHQANNLSIKMQISSSPTYDKFDGVNTTFPVLLKNGLRGIRKVARGEKQLWAIKAVTFEQIGNAS